MTIQQLTAKQRAHLKSLAHPLKAIVHIGKEGVSGTLIKAIEEALATRELIKAKVLEAAPADARAIANDIDVEMPDVHIVQIIGKTIVLYRRHPETPEIRLPR